MGKLKKASSILLLFVFLFANSGIAISVHYCENEIESINLFSGEEPTCVCHDSDIQFHACNNKVTLCKANDDLAQTQNLKVEIRVQKIIFQNPNHSLQETMAPKYLNPFSQKVKSPHWASCPIYVLGQVFLI